MVSILYILIHHLIHYLHLCRTVTRECECWIHNLGRAEKPTFPSIDLGEIPRDTREWTVRKRVQMTRNWCHLWSVRHVVLLYTEYLWLCWYVEYKMHLISRWISSILYHISISTRLFPQLLDRSALLPWFRLFITFYHTFLDHTHALLLPYTVHLYMDALLQNSPRTQ